MAARAVVTSFTCSSRRVSCPVLLLRSRAAIRPTASVSPASARRRSCTATCCRRLQTLQNRLWAEQRRSLLLVLQGMDASGKDGTIRTVLPGVNPQGCRVTSFKAPVGRDAAHDFLWRVHEVCPAHGEMGIFNRSHYEDVIAVRVRALAPESVWRPRLRHIREFERMLTDEGTTIVKVFLHISTDEQRRRLQRRIDDPEKNWKFRKADLDDRAMWDRVRPRI